MSLCVTSLCKDKAAPYHVWCGVFFVDSNSVMGGPKGNITRAKAYEATASSYSIRWDTVNKHTQQLLQKFDVSADLKSFQTEREMI